MLVVWLQDHRCGKFQIKWNQVNEVKPEAWSFEVKTWHHLTNSGSNSGRCSLGVKKVHWTMWNAWKLHAISNILYAIDYTRSTVCGYDEDRLNGIYCCSFQFHPQRTSAIYSVGDRQNENRKSDKTKAISVYWVGMSRIPSSLWIKWPVARKTAPIRSADGTPNTFHGFQSHLYYWWNHITDSYTL